MVRKGVPLFLLLYEVESVRIIIKGVAGIAFVFKVQYRSSCSGGHNIKTVELSKLLLEDCNYQTG